MKGPVLCHGFAAARATERGTPVRISVGPEELRALAAAYDLVAVGRLEAEMTVRPWRGSRGLIVEGDLEADLAQACIVSLEPVPARIAASFRQDPPDSWNGREIDLGALVEEEFVLNLDPYPRKPDAAFKATDVPESPDEPPGGPFAGLKAQWKGGG